MFHYEIDPAFVVALAIVLSILYAGWAWNREEEANREYNLTRAEIAARPFHVLSINGETALVERYDGECWPAKNAFPELEVGMWVAFERGAITDYFLTDPNPPLEG